jgi:hypothetical protein
LSIINGHWWHLSLEVNSQPSETGCQDDLPLRSHHSPTPTPGCFLRLHCWHSRQTIVGIAVGANTVYALCEIGIESLSLSSDSSCGRSPGQVFFAMGLMTIEHLPELFQLKAVSGLEFGWRSPTSWVLKVGLAPASHRERASARRDRQTSNAF